MRYRTKMLKTLGAVRLSRLTDETTSPVRQRERITWWSSGNEAEVVHIAEDLDVSGSLNPFARDSLGPWLTDERAGEWDVLVAWKLDRISRSARDTLNLLTWCEERGKRIVCVDDGIDSATQMGRVWIQLASIFAEVERTSIKERALASRQHLRVTGRWHGEAVPYWLIPVKQETGQGWQLEIDQESSQITLMIIDEFLDNKAPQSLAESLTVSKILSPRDRLRVLQGLKPKGAKWWPQSIFNMLESKVLLGHTIHDGVPVLGPDGTPIKKAPALIKHDVWERIQAKLAERRYSKTNNRTNKTSPLYGVALCFDCQALLHLRTQNTASGKYRYYYCPDKHGQHMLADMLESQIEEEFLSEFGNSVVHERILIPALDHTNELNEAISAFEEVTTMLGRSASERVKKTLQAQMEALDRKIAELEQLPVRKAHYELQPTGTTYAEEWAKRDAQGCRELLTRSGITFWAKLEGKGRKLGETGVWYTHLHIDQEMREKMSL